MPIETIYVVYPTCGAIENSGFSMEVQALAREGLLIGNNETECSKCGQMILWSKTEIIPDSVAKKRGA